METPPTIGSRFEFKPFRGARRVYELVEVLPEGTESTDLRFGCDRFTLRVGEESGFMPGAGYGVGWEFHVEEAWFTERTKAHRVAA